MFSFFICKGSVGGKCFIIYKGASFGLQRKQWKMKADETMEEGTGAVNWEPL